MKTSCTRARHCKLVEYKKILMPVSVILYETKSPTQGDVFRFHVKTNIRDVMVGFYWRFAGSHIALPCHFILLAYSWLLKYASVKNNRWITLICCKFSYTIFFFHVAQTLTKWVSFPRNALLKYLNLAGAKRNTGSTIFWKGQNNKIETMCNVKCNLLRQSLKQ